MAFSLGIPAWEQTQLQDLYDFGLLGNVNPTYLGLIDQAESSGQGSGPARSNTGYGGFFGLAANNNYPKIGGGVDSVSNAVLSGTDPASFDQQAVVAAGLFSSLLSQFGGNPIEAENAYQLGPNNPKSVLDSTSNEGAKLFTEAGIGPGGGSGPSLNTGGAATTPPASGTSGAPTSTASAISLPGIGGGLQALDKLLNPTGGSTLTQILTLGGSDILAAVEGLVVRALFSAAFIGVFYIGIKAISSGGGSSGGTSISDAIDSATGKVQSQQRIGQAQQRIDLQGNAQAQQDQRIRDASNRTQIAGRQQSVRESRERRLNAPKKVKKATKAVSVGAVGAVEEAFETVGGAIAV